MNTYLTRMFFSNHRISGQERIFVSAFYFGYINQLVISDSMPLSNTNPTYIDTDKLMVSMSSSDHQQHNWRFVIIAINTIKYNVILIVFFLFFCYCFVYGVLLLLHSAIICCCCCCFCNKYIFLKGMRIFPTRQQRITHTKVSSHLLIRTHALTHRSIWTTVLLNPHPLGFNPLFDT